MSFVPISATRYIPEMCINWTITWARLTEAYADTFYDKSVRPAFRALAENQLLAVYNLVCSLFNFENADEGQMARFVLLSDSRTFAYRCV